MLCQLTLETAEICTTCWWNQHWEPCKITIAEETLKTHVLRKGQVHMCWKQQRLKRKACAHWNAGKEIFYDVHRTRYNKHKKWTNSFETHEDIWSSLYISYLNELNDYISLCICMVFFLGIRIYHQHCWAWEVSGIGYPTVKSMALCRSTLERRTQMLYLYQLGQLAIWFLSCHYEREGNSMWDDCPRT